MNIHNGKKNTTGSQIKTERGSIINFDNLIKLLFKDGIKAYKKNNTKIKTSFLAKTSVSATG